MTFDLTKPEDWGPLTHGSRLVINEPFVTKAGFAVIDVETNEEDQLVGFAICNSPNDVHYFTSLQDEFTRSVLRNMRLVGHNLKADMHFLAANHIEVVSKQMLFDTMLASYVVCPTKESHGLKDLAKELLGWEWPAYKDIVGKGKSKTTLDKQPTDLVANYCGMDCLATYKLYEYYKRSLTPNQTRILEHMEMPINRLLFEMEQQGIQIDTDYLHSLNERFGEELVKIEKELERFTA